MLVAMIASDGAAMLGIYFLSAALHECGHLFAARCARIGVREIRFDFSGVRICTDREIPSYGAELVLAAAGPIVNLISVTASVIFFSLRGVALSEVVGAVFSFIEGELTVLGAVGFFAAVSVIQGGINLLPINTLDGGRILFCLLACLFGERCAWAVTKVTSFIAAFVLWTLALYLLLKISSGLGILVFSACIFLSTVKYPSIK